MRISDLFERYAQRNINDPRAFAALGLKLHFYDDHVFYKVKGGLDISVYKDPDPVKGGSAIPRDDEIYVKDAAAHGVPKDIITIIIEWFKTPVANQEKFLKNVVPALDYIIEKWKKEHAMKMEDLIAEGKDKDVNKRKKNTVMKPSMRPKNPVSTFDPRVDLKKKVAEADSRPVDNFTIDDIKKLERITDLNKMKLFAKQLISTPSQKPIRPEKVAWLTRTIDSKKSPMQVIKLMYDLLLGGEGASVIGSRHSTDPNSYRKAFGEGIKDTELANVHPSKFGDEGEYGMEGDYVKNQLNTMIRVMTHLKHALGDEEDLPEWVEEKVSQAKGMMVSVMDYVISEKERTIEKAKGKEISMDETKQRLDAKCWKGKHKEGTKIKGGVRVNNCVKSGK